MAFTFSDLQTEVKVRSIRGNSGGEFDTPVKNAVNAALFTIARTAKWRKLRRESTFETIIKYTTGSGGGTFTNDSKSITMSGATFLTDNIQPGRLIKLQGDSYDNTIDTITGETTLTMTKAYAGSTISGTGTYSILGQEEYNLPVQTDHRCFLWHEEWGSPFKMHFMTDQDFFDFRLQRETEATPEAYRMWGEDMTIEQLKEPSVITISSSASGDTSIDVTVFGIVSSFPDFETITTNGSDATTTVAGSKSFTSVERIVKASSTTGRITATANSANTTVATIPVGDTTSGIVYSKVRIFPLPNDVHPINVWYYKDPWALVNSGDVHELGAEFDEVIILLASSKIIYQNNKDEGDKFFNLYKDELAGLRKNNVDKIDWRPTLRRGGSVHGRHGPHPFLSYSQVGANFGSRVR